MKLNLKINGIDHEVDIFPGDSLMKTLRSLGFFSVKFGDEDGESGADTVLMDGKPVNSCLVLAIEVEGKKVTTIEGLAKHGQLHFLQESFIKHGAVQCGFCTPGMILSAKALFDQNPAPTEGEIKEAISGNLCRCTGYVKVVKAIEAVSGGSGKGVI